MIILGIVALLVLIVMVVVVAVRSDRDYTELDISKWRNDWQQIQQLVATSEQFAWRQAVIEADSLFDKFLKHQGVGGSSFGDRLKIIQSRYPALRQVWPAHLLRNRLVHEHDFVLKQAEAKKAIVIFAQGFKTLGLNLN